jgi:hypothetical protein
MPSPGRGVQVVLAWTERDADPPMGGIRLNSGNLERVCFAGGPKRQH